MIRKIYEVRGMMEWHPVFTVGRTKIQVPFTGGHLCEGSVNAASFDTSDGVVQTVIENSQAFRCGRIRLRQKFEITAPENRESLPPPDREANPAAVKMEFDDWGLAADFLQYEKGVPVELLMDENSCRAEARKFGLELVFKNQHSA